MLGVLTKIFISYCSADGLDLALRFKEILVTHGYDVFLYKHDVKLGQLVWDKIGKAIKDADAMIVLTTPKTHQSFGQRLEYNASLNHTRPTFAFPRKDTSPFDILYAFRFESFDDSDFDRKCEKLSRDLPDAIESYEEIARPLLETPSTPFGRDVAKPVGAFKDRTMGLDIAEVRKYEEAMLDGYLKSTIVRDISSVAEYNPSSDDGEPFFQIAKQFRTPKSWFTTEKDVDSTPFFNSIGEGTALGERNFLRSEILKQLAGKPNAFISNIPSFDRIIGEALNMAGNGLNPNVLLVPVDQYVKFVGHFRRRISWEQPYPYLDVNSETRLRIVWSNKYAQLEEFIMYHSNASVWTVKPDPETGRAFAGRISNIDLYPDEVRVLAKTVAKYKILRTEAFRILKL